MPKLLTIRLRRSEPSISRVRYDERIDSRPFVLVVRSCWTRPHGELNQRPLGRCSTSMAFGDKEQLVGYEGTTG